MPSNKPVNHTRKSVFSRVSRLFLKILLGIFILLLLVIVLVQTPYVQNIVREKAQDWLSAKLKTKLSIGKLYIGFPQTIELGNVYIEDLQKDTLLSGNAIKVNINMWKLLHSEIAINTVALEGMTAKIKRQLPDTSFNFQFIVDAFTSKQPVSVTPKDTAALKISLDKLSLTKVRLVYNDIVTGNDMEVWIEHSRTTIHKLDPTHMQYSIPMIELKGVYAKIYQDKPLQTPDNNTRAIKNIGRPNPLKLVLGKIDLSDIHLDYRNTVAALNSNINLAELKVAVKTFDLDKQVIVLDQLSLQTTTASVKIGRQATAAALGKKMEPVIDSANAGWRLQVNQIRVQDNNIRFDDDSKPRLSSGMDYAHINATQLNIAINNLLYSKDSIAGSIVNGSLREQSGFVLNSFHSNFLYTGQQAY